MELLEGADTRTFCTVLQHLSSERNAAVARRVFEFVRRDDFERRPSVEKRAAYFALADAAGDDLVAELEEEMLKGGWFQREEHRVSLARCLARMGTPASREALERGTHSRRGAIRRASEEGLVAWEPRA